MSEHCCDELNRCVKKRHVVHGNVEGKGNGFYVRGRTYQDDDGDGYVDTWIMWLRLVYCPFCGTLLKDPTRRPQRKPLVSTARVNVL